MVVAKLLLLVFTFGGVKSNEICLEDPCKCCRTNECSESAGNPHQCDGCIDGQTGKQCTIPCPENCVNCSQAFYDSQTDRTCFKCRNGYYNGKKHDLEIYRVNNDCSLSCKEGCSVCSSFHTCMQCNTGYYLIGGENDCKPCTRNCNTCKTEKDCEKCSDGYFWNFEMCQQCKANCKTCTSFQDCIVCDTGFFLSDQDCSKCSTDCLQCITQNVCQRCRTGYYLTNNMSEHVCNKCKTGCSACDSANTCESCIRGYTINNGQCHVCPSTCHVCEADNSCVSCKDGYFNHYGRCQTCPKSCKSCISKDKCTKCIDGFYGEHCAHSCFENCFNNQCDNTTGQCITCRNGSYLAENNDCVNCPAHCLVCQSQVSCQVCADGYRGEICENKCYNCKAGTRCGKSDGYCRDECVEGNSGPDCNIKCDSSCMTCDRYNPKKCKMCAHNTYGGQCTKPCSKRCKLSTCNGEDGFCTHGCENGYWGKLCEYNCSEYCPGNVCSKSNVHCTLECKTNNSDHGCICPSGCTCGVNGTCGSIVGIQQTNHGGLPLAEFILVSFVMSIIIIIVVLLILYKRRKHKRNVGNLDEMLAVRDPTDQVELEDNGSEISTDGDMYYNTASRYCRRINLDELASCVAKMRNDDFVKEFEKLPQELIKPYKESRKEENAWKNRYIGIYPYDETRVVVKDKTSDYINANYVHGYHKLKAYIACSGPTIKTMGDMSVFWSMVWQDRCGKIVMLTKLREGDVSKCDQYWPNEDCSQKYGDINIICESEQKLGHFIKRTFKLQMESESREVVQLHFTAWPDKGVPKEISSLVEFRKQVNNISSELDGPSVIHCSAGVGRTGTYIALDILTREGEAERSVDIFSCVRNLREQRVLMVQTAEQYEFLHRAVLSSLKNQLKANVSLCNESTV